MATDAQLAIGLMSGTSVDGIDGVLLRIARQNNLTIEAHLHLPFAADVRRDIHSLLRDGAVALADYGDLHSRLGELYAQAANELKAKVNSQPSVIGCHGQTIYHQPSGASPFTLQLGNAAIVAARTDIATVADFRSADIAVGGQGAPFAPMFHRAVFADSSETRAVINLGGIANVTHLPAGDDVTVTVTGFDTGPANTLTDNWCQRHFDAAFDDGGKRAAAATVNDKLLAALLADEYFARAAPKSTGREYFNLKWLDAILAAEHATDLPPQDILATLTALTADSIAVQLARLKPAVQAIYVCGGGVHNATLMQMLRAKCGIEIFDTNKLGIDPQWVEASAFAWLAHQTINRTPSILPSVTGAARATVAGAVYFPD